jgi:hypothetical protein
MDAIVTDLAAWRLNNRRPTTISSIGKSGSASTSDPSSPSAIEGIPEDDLLSALNRIESAALDLRRLIVKGGLPTEQRPSGLLPVRLTPA